MEDVFKNVTLAHIPRIKNLKKSKLLKEKRREKKTFTPHMHHPIPDYIISQWIEAMDGKRKTMPIGSVPFLYCQKETYSSWLYTTITAMYRKRAEWHALITDMWNGPRLFEEGKPCILNHSNPFYYSHAIAIHLDKFMCLNIALRMSILRHVQRRLLAKMDKRVVGEDDLHTTTRIPAAAMVAVYDFKTRAKYIFHTNTILKTILASLKYCAYGISSPKEPKNPYTNLEWTKPQLMSITQQIVRNLSGLHRIPPPLFLNYYNCNYMIPNFAKFCERELGINAGEELFKNKDDYNTREIYRETMDDISSELNLSLPTRLCDLVVNRKLSVPLQEKWDKLIVAIWIYTNIHVLYGDFTSYEDMTDTFREIYKETRTYMYTKMPSRRRREPPTNGSLIRTYAFSALLDAAIYTETSNHLIFEDEEPPLTVNL
jgi:hypothetical protein